ncbi:MAG: hypothetical protein IIZ32_07975 [Ruminococcus sp.]|nr:hypothetical protein [Ruminococcus sp.]
MSKKVEKKNKSKKKTAKIPPEKHHKYLNELGISSTEGCIFNTREIESKKSQKRFDKERELHSFDSRETYSLDYTLATWLYEHLMVLKEIGGNIVDFTGNEFDLERIVKIGDDGTVETETVTLNEEEGIDLACKYLAKSLTSTFHDRDRVIYEQAALRIVTEMLPGLWW